MAHLSNLRSSTPSWGAASALTGASRSLNMAEGHDWCSMHFEQHLSDAVFDCQHPFGVQQGSCQDEVLKSNAQYAAHGDSSRAGHADAGGAGGLLAVCAQLIQAGAQARDAGATGTECDRLLHMIQGPPAHECCAAWGLPHNRLLHCCRCITVAGSQRMHAALHPEAAP